MAKASPGRTRKTRNTNGSSEILAKSPVTITGHTTTALEEEIRRRAYELYEQEGRQEGRDQEYWLRAEAEVRQRAGVKTA